MKDNFTSYVIVGWHLILSKLWWSFRSSGFHCWNLKISSESNYHSFVDNIFFLATFKILLPFGIPLFYYSIPNFALVMKFMELLKYKNCLINSWIFTANISLNIFSSHFLYYPFLELSQIFRLSSIFSYFPLTIRHIFIISHCILYYFIHIIFQFTNSFSSYLY